MNTINPTISRKLLLKAKEAAQNAYAPYSQFSVGAAILTQKDNIYSGCNVENASYGLTICAERNALTTMVANGETKIKAIAVYAPKSQECFPCGACRQFVYEFSSPETIVLIEKASEEVKSFTVSELLPHAFGPQNL